MKLGEAFIEVRPDTKDFRAQLQRETHADVAAVGRTLQQALIGGAFLAGAKKATDAASQLEQAVGGTSAVFGESARSIDRWSKDAAEAAGLSERAARELTSQIGGLLKGFGFAEDEAANLSIKLAQLGADLAATFGGKPEEAVQALAAALRGETDPIERYGIALNQTLVNQKAVALGLAASTSSVDQHAKAQATLALITERSADAQGQFAREADTAAGQAAISAAKTENAAADLGENLLPIYTKLAETVGVVADAFGSLPEPVQTALIALAGIAALAGPTKAAASAISDLSHIARTQLSKGLDVASVGAYNLVGNLGRVATGAGVLGAAFVGASIILDRYEKDKADALRLEKEYTSILAEQTDGVQENAVAFAGQEILKGGLGEKLREAGVDLQVLTDAIVKNGDEVAQLDNKYSTLYGLPHALDEAGLEGSALADELLRLADVAGLSDKQTLELVNRLADQAEGYQAGAREADNKAEADKQAGVEAETAAPKVEELADKLDANEQAAKDAAESVDLFREAVEKALAPLDFQGAVDERTQALLDLASNIEERRGAVDAARQRIADIEAQRSESSVADARAIADAEERLAEARARVADTDSEREAKARAVADAEEALARAREDAGDGGTYERQMAEAQAELQAALDATSLELEGNSDAALRNREELRNLVDDSVAIIEAKREEGASLEELKLIRDNEVQSLRDQLAQMGYNKEQIEVYVDAIEAIPLTRATTLTVETAKAQARIKELAESLQALDPQQQMSIDAAVIDRNLQRASAQANRAGYAAGGFPFDGEFLVHADEVLRKRGADLEVIAGPTPTPLGTEALSADLLLAIQQQNIYLAEIAGNTSGPTTGQRLRRVQTMAGAI